MRVEDLQVMYPENKLYGQPSQYVLARSKWRRTTTKLLLSLCYQNVDNTPVSSVNVMIIKLLFFSRHK